MSAETVGAATGFAVGGPIGALVGYSAGAQHKNLQEAKNARRAQETLEGDRRKALANEAAAREAAAAKAATAGQRVGRGGLVSVGTGYGFGSGNTQTGLGRGNLFGN